MCENGEFGLPDEELSSLKVAQVEELPHAQRPSQGGDGIQVGQVLLKGPAAYGDGLCCEVSPQLFSCTRTHVVGLWSFIYQRPKCVIIQVNNGDV